MFSLVVAAMAILTTVTLCLAGFIYLGSSYMTAGTKAEVVQFGNASAQIMAAATLYQTENITTLDDGSQAGKSVQTMVDLGYLKDIPTPPKNVAAGAMWHVGHVGSAPYVSIDIDDSSPGAYALCAEAKRHGGGCTYDLNSLKVSTDD